MATGRTKQRNLAKRRSWKTKQSERQAAKMSTRRMLRVAQETESLRLRQEQDPDGAWDWLLQDTVKRIHVLTMDHAWDNVTIARSVFGDWSAEQLAARITSTYAAATRAR